MKQPIKINNKMITLIAIVIIVVLIILLSGVTIKNVTEKSQLFSKAINEQENANQQVEEQEGHNIDAIYVVNSTDGDNINVTIILESDDEIEQVQTPNQNIISTHKNKLAIDYSVVSGEDYTFKIKRTSDSELKDYVLKADINARPEILQDTTPIYPILMPEGVKLRKTVNIDYGEEETNNYYSLDNGDTWMEYEGELVIEKECTLLAKKIKNIGEREIIKLAKEEIKMNLAPDALGLRAYDGNYNTGFSLDGRRCRMQIDDSMKGKRIAGTWGGSSARACTYYFISDVGSQIPGGTQSFSTKYRVEWIPSNASWFSVGGGNIYEIGPYNT